MSTYDYKCSHCKRDVSELEVWEEPDGIYCISCLFKDTKLYEKYINNQLDKL